MRQLWLYMEREESAWSKKETERAHLSVVARHHLEVVLSQLSSCYSSNVAVVDMAPCTHAESQHGNKGLHTKKRPARPCYQAVYSCQAKLKN